MGLSDILPGDVDGRGYKFTDTDPKQCPLCESEEITKVQDNNFNCKNEFCPIYNFGSYNIENYTSNS